MKIICIGRNYLDHAKELNNQAPTSPVFFMKPDTAIVRNNDPFFLPDFSTDLHYEVEIVLKINRVGKSIQEKFAHRYFNEIGLGIDFTARDLQRNCQAKGLPWEIAKSFDNSAPISNFIELGGDLKIDSIDFHLDINGKTVQKGNTSDMIFNAEKLISYVSGFITLKIGDLIFTGTPAGVGPVAIGDHLEGFIGDKKMLDFYVK